MSAIILLAIVAMWAAVLGPVWLRRHDAIYESRSVDKFTTAMRVLARRSPRQVGGVHSRAVLMPGRPDVPRVSEVSVSGRAGDRPVAHRSPAIYRLRRNLGVLALIDFLTIAIWAGVGSTAILGLHLISDVVTGVAVVGLNRAVERERQRAQVDHRRRRVAGAMAREQAIVAETAPRRSSVPVWRDPAATGAKPQREIVLTPVELETAAQPQAPRRSTRIPATSLSKTARTIDLTQPGSWREEIDLRNVDEEIRAAAMISDDSGLDDLIQGRRRRVV